MPLLDDALYEADRRIWLALEEASLLPHAPTVLVARALLLIGDEDVLFWLPTEVRDSEAWELRLDAFTATKWVHVRQVGSPTGCYDRWEGTGLDSETTARSLPLGDLCRVEIESQLRARVRNNGSKDVSWDSLVWRLAFRDGSEYRLEVRTDDVKPRADRPYEATQEAADFIAGIARNLGR